MLIFNPAYKYLTLKALSEIVADDILFYFYILLFFQRKISFGTSSESSIQQMMTHIKCEVLFSYIINNKIQNVV